MCIPAWLTVAAHVRAEETYSVQGERADQDSGSEWRLHGHTYSNRRFSNLSQITTDNIHRLVPRWIYQTGTAASFQATPIVARGVMYISLPFSSVAALDARTGRQLWRYDHKRTTPKLCCGPQNRGVAVDLGKVYVATVDARLIALDERTGQVVWDTPLTSGESGTESAAVVSADRQFQHLPVSGSTGVGAAMAPLVFDGKVYVGITGVGYGLHLDGKDADAGIAAVIGFSGQYGRPGFLAAFDAETGEKVWQFDTIPSSGWEGEFRSTTSDGLELDRDVEAERASAASYAESWRFGGGTAWATPAVDVDAGVLFFGTGNPSPQMNDRTRPGDNLYTVSLIALDARTGRLIWYYQQVPHDLWGYDVASGPVLFEFARGDEDVPAVGVAGKTGWFYVFNRSTGEILFKSQPFVPQENMFQRPTKDGVRIAPAAAGGANWSPVALNIELGLVYVAAMHRPMLYQVHEREEDGKAVQYTSMEMTNEDVWGTLSAIDIGKGGEIRWQTRTSQPLLGGVLATAGNLVLTGEGDGHLSAFDAATGTLLWRFQCGAGVNAPPISYEIEGTQYIAVAVGGSQLFGYRQGGALIVFALPEVE